MTKIAATSSKTTLLKAALLIATVAFPISEASAVGMRTKMACVGDYLSYCSQHQVGSPALRQCMSAAGPKLSKSCVNALIADGEVSKSEVERRSASLR